MSREFFGLNHARKPAKGVSFPRVFVPTGIHTTRHFLRPLYKMVE